MLAELHISTDVNMHQRKLDYKKDFLQKDQYHTEQAVCESPIKTLIGRLILSLPFTLLSFPLSITLSINSSSFFLLFCQPSLTLKSSILPHTPSLFFSPFSVLLSVFSLFTLSLLSLSSCSLFFRFFFHS